MGVCFERGICVQALNVHFDLFICLRNEEAASWNSFLLLILNAHSGTPLDLRVLHVEHVLSILVVIEKVPQRVNSLIVLGHFLVIVPSLLLRELHRRRSLRLLGERPKRVLEPVCRLAVG